jgi:hypothetical protein
LAGIHNLKGEKPVAENNQVRWGWLKFMYIYTIVVSGGFGMGMIFFPEVTKSVFAWPVNEPIVFGIVGSVYVVFGLMSILGLRSPLKFVPILLLQFCYKVIWFVGVVLPLLVSGRFPNYAIPMAVLFTTFIVGDLMAIPFPYVFAKQPGQPAQP